jgi:hypothetical protein
VARRLLALLGRRNLKMKGEEEEEAARSFSSF